MQYAPRGAFSNTLTFIKLTFSIKTFVLSIFKWPLKTLYLSGSLRQVLLNKYPFFWGGGGGGLTSAAATLLYKVTIFTGENVKCHWEN